MMNKVYKQYRKGVRVVVYKKDKKDKFLFLILHRIKRWKGWELVKGGKFSHETYLEAAKREIKEETNCCAQYIQKLNIKDKFDYPKEYQAVFKKKGQISVCYVCEITCQNEINLNDEHDKYEWLNFQKAFKKLTHSNSKKILKYANQFLKNTKNDKA